MAKLPTRAPELPSGPAGEHRYRQWRSPATVGGHSQRRHQHQHWDRWNRDRHHAGANECAAGGHHSTGHFPESRRAAGQWQQSFTPTTASGDPIVGTPGGSEGLGTLQQGMLEDSNINVVDQFIQMIVTQRAYESNSKVVQAADQMLQDVNHMSH